MLIRKLAVDLRPGGEFLLITPPCSRLYRTLQHRGDGEIRAADMITPARWVNIDPMAAVWVAEDGRPLTEVLEL